MKPASKHTSFWLVMALLLRLACESQSTTVATALGRDGRSFFEGRIDSLSMLNKTRLDCNMRMLALNYSKRILRVIGEATFTHDTHYLQQAVHDALQLTQLCHHDEDSLGDELSENRRSENRLQSSEGLMTRRKLRAADSQGSSSVVIENLCNGHATACIFVSPSNSYISSTTTLHEDGSMNRPWSSLHDAVQHATILTESMEGKDSSANPKIHTFLLLRQGTHFLQGRTLTLSSFSKHQHSWTLMAFPGEKVWISGGLPLQDVIWKPEPNGVFVGDLSNILLGHTLPKTPSLFTSTRRYFRARYPNSNPEIDFVMEDLRRPKSPKEKLELSRFPTWLEGKDVLEWMMPPKGSPPEFVFYDFATNPPPGVPFKNDSTMEGYNWYASGSGGVCSDLWGPTADSYWCSNASQGGWAFVDQDCAKTGQMQIPAGMIYNRSLELLSPLHNATLEGGYVFAQHSQSWSMHMFEIASHSHADATMTFAKGGGKQGGRNWCRCDQCTYAGSWCGQHQTPPNNNDQRLIGGNWMIENVKEFLDQPGEYYLDREQKLLYVKPNKTDDLKDFTIGVLTELISLRDTVNVRIQNVGFRDQAATFLEDPWSAPSGGDWSLRRGGAVYMENSTKVEVSGCHFFRLDGSAIFLSKRTRNVTIAFNHFEWLGENAIATWGDTDAYDGTGENFPMDTVIQYNVMRELGIYQIQSSALGQNKAALSSIQNNIMFNMPRAAINFNDMVGGGDVVEGNLIFNTCRKSGDHGPINSWDRQAYLTKLRDGTTPSFDPIPRTIRHNFIFANYGASQGVDNDDGSSWYRIQHNIFYMADGFKMDYGGHDSVFEGNLILSYPYDGNCFGMGNFFEGHGDVLRRNRCILGIDQTKHTSAYEDKDMPRNVGRFYGECAHSHLTMVDNEYYTPDGVTTIGCEGDSFHSLKEMQDQFGLEIGSFGGPLPDDSKILEWANDLIAVCA